MNLRHIPSATEDIGGVTEDVFQKLPLYQVSLNMKIFYIFCDTWSTPLCPQTTQAWSHVTRQASQLLPGSDGWVVVVLFVGLDLVVVVLVVLTLLMVFMVMTGW